MVCQSGSVQPASFLRFFQYQGRLCATLIPADDARVTDRDVHYLFESARVVGRFNTVVETVDIRSFHIQDDVF